MMKRAIRWGLVGFSALGLSSLVSCVPPTSFKGSSEFPGGALGCFNQCEKVRMDMASFVYVGEYSTACACKPKIVGATTQASAQSDIEGAVTAAGAGVEMQRRAAEEQRQQQQQQQRQTMIAK